VKDNKEVSLMRPLFGILAAASLLFGATAAQALESIGGLPGVTIGHALGAPTPYGTPPGSLTGAPLPSYSVTPIMPGTSGYSNNSTSNINLTPGSAGEPLYDPNGPLPAPITSDQTAGSSGSTTSSGM
jgi:hypothetical protein